MPVKDYYKILELPPQANLKDIKRSFRRLALRFHPDTNQENKHAAAWFREVQEAYDTLTDPAKKEAYLQERWLLQSSGRPFAKVAPQTPELVLAEARSLAIYSKSIDHFRMDPDELRRMIAEVLNDEKLEVLKSFNLPGINRQIVAQLLEASDLLTFDLFEPVCARLKKVCSEQSEMLQLIEAIRLRKKRQQWWDKHQGWVIAAITFGLCALVFLLSKG
jgi:molecular chaperone DnaJ